MYSAFETEINQMNQRYKLAQIPISSWVEVTNRLKQFQDILDKECAEIVDIQVLADKADDSSWGNPGEGGLLPLQVVTALADLLGDIIVYCTSESQRWGIPLAPVLQIIMASNTSKLGADGQPIINPENGKFEKGPNYWKPEPLIEWLLTHQPSEWGKMKFTRNEVGVVSVEVVEEEEEVTEVVDKFQGEK